MNKNPSIHIQSQKLNKQLKFLQQQNQRLKDQLSDAKDLIQMNKIQIDVLSKNQKIDKKLIEVIYNYRQQLQSLQLKNKQLNQLNHKHSSQKIIIQKINHDLIFEQKNIQELSKNRIKQLNQIIKKLQQKASNCQKNHQNYDNITGFVQRHRQIIIPSDQAIEFKNKQREWNDQINLLTFQLQQVKKNQQNLLLTNGVLRNKVVTLQAKLAMPNKNLGQILDKSLKRLMLYFIQTQKKMLTGDDSDSQQQDLQLIAPQLLSLFPQQSKNMKADFKVPALDLLKVRNYQMKGIPKIIQDLQRRSHLTPAQQIQRFSIQLQFTRRQLTKNMIQLKSQSQKRKFLQKICQQIQERNNFLIKSNQIYQKKIDSIKKEYQNNKQKMISVQKLMQLQDSSFDLRFLKRDSFKQKNLQNNKNRQFQVNKYLSSVQTPFQFKLHLQLLAKDLNRNQKLKKLNQNKDQNTQKNKNIQKSQKLKRSTSNPFLYFNERKEQIMQIKPEKEYSKPIQNTKERQRLQQTQYMTMGQQNHLKFSQDLDQFEDA